MTAFNSPTPRGIGFSHQPGLKQAIGAGWDLIDFIELSPDTLCVERIQNGQRKLVYNPALLNEVLECAESRALVVHGLGLSIGSATGWNEDYLRILDELHELKPFAWHSEHLAFLLTKTIDGQPLHTGVPLPIPFTDEALEMLVPRAAALNTRYAVPFLLENFTYYLPGLPTEHNRDEVAFLNALTEQSGCGLLLDLYNFYCNAINFGFDPFAALSRLRLDRVIEIHIAGGATHEGLLTDVHSQVVPETVWRLLEWIVPQTPNLSGIVYEVLEQAFHLVGVKAICGQLERAHAIWARRNSGGAYAAA